MKKELFVLYCVQMALFLNLILDKFFYGRTSFLGMKKAHRWHAFIFFLYHLHRSQMVGTGFHSLFFRILPSSIKILKLSVNRTSDFIIPPSPPEINPFVAFPRYTGSKKYRHYECIGGSSLSGIFSEMESRQKSKDVLHAKKPVRNASFLFEDTAVVTAISLYGNLCCGNDLTPCFRNAR